MKKSENKQVNILIKDTGVGIAPEDRNKLFQKFSRIQTDATRKIPGTGLGLWITKSMIKKMNGNIYVDSIIGQGTVFTILMPKITNQQNDSNTPKPIIPQDNQL